VRLELAELKFKRRIALKMTVLVEERAKFAGL
jgi:hypothetical protein